MTSVYTPSPGDRPALQSDVIACYQTILGRPPESVEVVNHAMADRPSLWTVIHRLLSSDEAIRRQGQAAAGRYGRDQDSRNIEVNASPAAQAELTRHIEAIWAQYGRTDAYFSVLTHPAFLADRITGGAIEAFYATGFETVAEFARACQRNGVEPERSARVLELGCGVGRLGEAFRDLYATYIGVDISAEHLAIAREHFRHRGLAGVELRELKTFLEDGTDFDILYSIIVLQHNPPPIIHSLLDVCLGRLRAGGYAYFQIPCFLYDYSFSTQAYLAGKGQKDEMEMHALPQRMVFDLLAKHGLIPIEVIPDPHIGPLGFSYTFFARKIRGASK